MAHWTKPITWVTGETLTASMFNTQIRDQLDFLRDRDRVHAVQTQDNNLKDNEWEVIRFGGEGFDRGGMHSSRKREAQLRFRQDGLYYLLFKMAFQADTLGGVGDRFVQLRRNSNQNDSGGHRLGMWNAEVLNNSYTYVDGYVLARMRKGDHVNLFVKQNSGERLKAIGGSANTAYFQAVQMGG